MQFKQQSIRVARSKPDATTGQCYQEIDAVIGIGSGLAYHLCLEEDRYYLCLEEGQQVEGTAYTLTHVPSGLAIGGEWVAETEQEAQAWLEQVARFMNWNVDTATLIQQVIARGLTGSTLKQHVDDILKGVTAE